MVLDVAGRVVWSAPVTPTDAQVEWDLVDDNGKPLANGLYLYFFLGEDGGKSDVRRLVIDR